MGRNYGKLARAMLGRTTKSKSCTPTRHARPARPLPLHVCRIDDRATIYRSGRWLTRIIGLVLALTLLVAVRPHIAFAQSADLGPGGRWKQGPLREDFTVQQWLPGCGPAPTSSTTGGGEIVSVQQEGDELSIVGAGRTYKTNQCYDLLPTISREAHSREASGRSWLTRCATPPTDPRRAVINTRVNVTSPDHVDLIETGRYEITLKDGRCIADVKRTRSFDRVQSAAPAASTAETPAAPVSAAAPEPKPCADPGDPARLEVRPARKLLRTGESFTFRAVVTDAKGCRTNVATTWAAPNAPKGLTLDGATVHVADDVPEGPYEIVATAADKGARVRLEVSSPANFDALLVQSGLGASGESTEAVVTSLGTGSLGGQEVRIEGAGRRRRALFVGVIGGIAMFLGVLALVGVRRSRKAKRLEREADIRHEAKVREVEERRREKVAAHADQQRAHEESVELARRLKEEKLQASKKACPVCRRQFAGATTFCPEDGAKLVSAREVEAAAKPGGGICPVCQRAFEPGVKVCPEHGEALVPYAARAVLGPPAQTAGPKGKICPTCGDRFEGTATFCGKDGTRLVLVN